MTQEIAKGLATVDALDVSVLVDNVTDSLSTVPDGVTNEVPRLMKLGMSEACGEVRCCAHHGLSVMLTVHAGGAKRTLMFDAGPEAYTLARNSEKLQAPFGDVEAVVLSHGHWDHAGGLVEAVQSVARARNGRPFECHVNPDMFVSRGTLRHGGGVMPAKDIPKPGELAAAGATVVNAPEARLLVDGLYYLSGEIPRVTPYERGLPGHMRRTADGASWEPDPWIMDERYLAVNVKGKGVVVFTACSHAGVVNVLTDAHNVFGDAPLYAVMGGFHLSGPQVEDIILDTVRDMHRFKLKRVVPAHCTGWRAVHALANVYPDGVLAPSAVGKLFQF